jgi:hypothetical protein
MTRPSSFATICTSNCAFELSGLLLSLSVYHPNETIYILSDTKTKDIINNITPKPKLNIGLWSILVISVYSIAFIIFLFPTLSKRN